MPNPRPSVPSGQIYRHYKGEYYELICVAYLEGAGQKYEEWAVYRNARGVCWTRPMAEFNEFVSEQFVGGKTMRRFELVFNPDIPS